MLSFILIGVLSLPYLKRETFPEFTLNTVEIRLIYPGASAQEVDLTICRRLEEVLEGIAFMGERVCQAREGLGVMTAEMQPAGSIDTFLSSIQTQVEAIDTFPEIIEPPIITRLNLVDPVASIAITGPMTPSHLKAYADSIKDKLLLVPNISQVEVHGFSDRQIQIIPRSESLHQYGLSVFSLADRIRRQSVDLPAGLIETQGRQILIRFTEERRQPKDFQDLVIVVGERGGEIPLREIAEITTTFKHPEHKILFDGQPAAFLRVFKAKTEDSLTVLKAMTTFIDQQQQQAPPGVTFILTEDATSLIQDRLDLLIKNGFQGFLLVFGVMMLFFSFRYSFWIACGLPISFLGTFGAMLWLGMSINMITMVALLIAIGILMDDAIVIAESIALHRAQGALEAAVQGVRQVAPGVLSSFATTVCVFAPLMFIQGDIGAVLRVLPLVLIAVLTLSLIEAFLILPHHIVSTPHTLPSRFHRRIESGFNWVRDVFFDRVLQAALRARYLVIGGVIAGFLGTLSLVAGGTLKVIAFPKIDGDILQARILLTAGTPLAHTEHVVSQLLQALEKTQQELEYPDLIRHITVFFGQNLDASETGPHLATISLDLTPDRPLSIQTLIAQWRSRLPPIPDVLAITYKQPQVGPAGADLEIRLQSTDLDRLYPAKTALKTYLSQFQGLINLEDDLRYGKPEVRLSLLEGATTFGFEAQTIANQIRSAFYGTIANEIQLGPDTYEINVQLNPQDRNTLSDLTYFDILLPNPGGYPIHVPLSAIARLEEGRGYALITRIDGRPTVSIRAQTQNANPNEIIALTQTEFLDRLLPEDFPSVSYRLAGARQEQTLTQVSMITGVGIGLIGVFFLLSLLFRSYIESVIVMISIPLALIGVFWGHLIMSLDLSMPSIMGFASLSGIVVNNAILLVQWTQVHLQHTNDLQTALRLASKDRFRAIILTSITTIFGLLPILAETNPQAQVLIPLITSLAFGLISSAFLILIVLPSFYGLLADCKLIPTT